MAKSSFDKATAKMFKGFGSPVRIAEGSGGSRLSSEERERLEKELEDEERRREAEAREDERRKVIENLVEMKVIQPAAGPAVAEQAAVKEPVVEEAPKRGKGRPLKDPEVTEYVLMNFRVPADFRQKLKVMAAQQGRQAIDVFNEAFELLFAKYPDFA